MGPPRSLGLLHVLVTVVSCISLVRLVLCSADALDEGVRASLAKSARQILDVLRLEARPLSTVQVAEIADVTRSTAARRGHSATLRGGNCVAQDLLSALA